MSRPVINPGMLIWSGEHWINYLRKPGEDTDSGMVSLYHTRFSAAGEGNVAFVDIPGDPGLCALCTDNRDVARFIKEMIKGRGNVFDRDMFILDARIMRGGDIRTNPSWIIETPHDRVVASWSGILPPVIAEGDAPTFREDLDFFTLLFFTEEAQITLNGAAVAGKPYTRDIWSTSIGGDRSSCVFALAETMTKVTK
ncbi:MAG: hypothetical protein HY326_03450 [Chloroflexi bacterium]|nr:hypothetical protein [Chloroflexota bacterium]